MNLKSMKLFLCSVLLMGLFTLAVIAQVVQQIGKGREAKTTATQMSGPSEPMARPNESTYREYSKKPGVTVKTTEKKSSQVTNVGFTPETSVAVKKNLINARKRDHQFQQKPQAKENIHNPEYLRSKMGISADGRYTMTDELYNQLNEGQRRFVNSTNKIIRIK